PGKRIALPARPQRAQAREAPFAVRVRVRVQARLEARVERLAPAQGQHLFEQAHVVLIPAQVRTQTEKAARVRRQMRTQSWTALNAQHPAEEPPPLAW